MNPSSLFQKLQNAWRQSSRRRKILAGCVIIASIFSGWFTFYLVNLLLGPSDWDGIPPHLSSGIKITDEGVYQNGTVLFTAICDVESYKNFPIPEGDLYQIKKAFICVEDDLIDFNSTFGEIKNISDITIIEGDLTLSANEQVCLMFQTSFALHNVSHLYVGVLVVRATSSSGVITRWDKYTSVIP